MAGWGVAGGAECTAIERPSPHRRLGPEQSERQRLRCGRRHDRWSYLSRDDPRETEVEVVLAADRRAGPGRLIPPPNQGMADTLDEAKAAFAKRYEEVGRGK